MGGNIVGLRVMGDKLGFEVGFEVTGDVLGFSVGFEATGDLLGRLVGLSEGASVGMDVVGCKVIRNRPNVMFVCKSKFVNQ